MVGRWVDGVDARYIYIYMVLKTKVWGVFECDKTMSGCFGQSRLGLDQPSIASPTVFDRASHIIFFFGSNEITHSWKILIFFKGIGYLGFE
jgi:hypothetical protein